MKRLASIIATVLLSSGLFAQDFIGEIASMVKGARITCDYSYSTTTGTIITGKGTAVLQGECYSISGNGLEIICDSNTRWTKDPLYKEVYIEKAGDFGKILSDVEGFLRSIPDLKYEDGVLSGTFLFPGEENGFFCSLSNVRRVPVTDGKEFFFDTSALDSSWVVTDLR